MSANFSPEMEGYSGIKPFRFWCQKVLPLTYDDSLSYYELLCKVVDYVNHLIEDVTAAEDNVTALNTAYGELEDYVNDNYSQLTEFVNNYFDNLDVSQEIDNKLDTMASDGSLTALINPLVASSIPSLVTTWLDTNVDPTGSAVVVDSSLTVSGAAADAKVVGRALDKKVDKALLGINMFNKNVVDAGYVKYTDGTIVSNASYYASDYIPIDGDELYRIWGNDNQQLAIYNSSKEYLSGYSTSGAFNLADASQLPNGAAYIRFTIPSAFIDTAGLYLKDEYGYLRFWDSSYVTYKDGCVADRLKSDKVVFNKTVTTGSEFLTAIDNIYLTDGYEYNIYIAEGDYNIDLASIESLRNHSEGIMLPNNTNLIGLGSGAHIVVDLTGAASAKQQAYSPISIKYNNKLKNLKIDATNCRYCVHDDNSNTVSDIVQVIEDCTFNYISNSDHGWNYPAAWGEGTCSGANVTFNRCTFISPLRAVVLHNNSSFTKPSIHTFNDCAFIGTDNYCFNLTSTGSGVKDVIVFNGCMFKGLFRSDALGYPSVTACDFDISGTGNSPVCDDGYYGSAFAHLTKFSDECYKFINNTGSSITKGTFMKVSTDDFVPMESTDTTKSFAGVLLDTVAAGGVGYIKHKGCYRITGSVSNASIGTKVGVASNAFEALSDDAVDSVGRVFWRDTDNTRYYVLLTR